MLVAEDKREEHPRVNPLQLRNAITHEKPTSAGLMYVEIVLNEMATRRGYFYPREKLSPGKQAMIMIRGRRLFIHRHERQIKGFTAHS